MRFIAVFLLVFSSSCFAADPETTSTPAPVVADVGAPVAFSNGVDAFQKNDLPAARDWFRGSLMKDTSQVVAWYDLGVSEQRLGNKGLAMAYLRKALTLMPGFQPAQSALAFTRKSLEKPDIPHEVEGWETLRSNVLVAASSYQFAYLTMVLFFITGWFALLYSGRRRRALLDEKALPAFPLLAVLAGLLFAIFLVLSISKIVDDQDLRGTVITKKIEAKALPDSTSTTLFELYEGLEVLIQQSRQGWVQVTYPGGATGWIPRAAVFTNAEWISK